VNGYGKTSQNVRSDMKVWKNTAEKEGLLSRR
jgi:hypothetical protein